MYPQVTYPVVIWGLYVGIVAAAIITVLSRLSAGSAVRALLAEGATDKQSAKTAAELGLSSLGRRALRGSLCGKLFLVANPLEAEKSAKKKRSAYQKARLDMSAARFYLPKEREYEALDRFPRQSIPAHVAALVLLTAFFITLHFFLPSIVELAVNSFPG